MRADHGIALFDSGLGGVSVFNALAQAFPKENFYYLGDTARLPYGTKSAHTLKKYVQKNVDFLSQFPIKLLIVACNSASSVLDEMNFNLPFPVWSVIPMGASQALKLTKTKNIMLWATQTTIDQKKYSLFFKRNSKNIQLHTQACPMLVPLVEQGHLSHPATDLFIKEYLKSFPPEADTLILGCTHYPFLKDAISRQLPEKVQIIESGELSAQALSRAFKAKKVLPKVEPHQQAHEFYLTDHSIRFENTCKSWLSKNIKVNFQSVDL